MKKRLSFSQVTVLSFTLFSTGHIIGSSEETNTIPTATPIAVNSTAVSAPANSNQQPTGWFALQFLDNLFGNPSTASDQAPRISTTAPTLSHELKTKAAALLALRKQQLTDREALHTQQTTHYLAQFEDFKKTASALSAQLDQFVPALVTETEDVLLDIRTAEETTARRLLETSVAIGNGTREERGHIRTALKDAGQTKANFRPESPTESIEDFAKRITNPTASTLTTRKSRTLILGAGSKPKQ